MADHLAGGALWPLDDEERLLQATAREFARRELGPGIAQRDEAEHFERGLFTRMGELGLTAAPLPPAVGGTGFSYRAWTVAMEEIAYVVPHQANYRIIAAASRRSGIPLEKFYMNLMEYANTSAASIPMARAPLMVPMRSTSSVRRSGSTSHTWLTPSRA